MKTLRDGSIIMAGNGSNDGLEEKTYEHRYATVIKADSNGHVLWGKELSSMVSGLMNISVIHEFKDGSLVLAGHYNDARKDVGTYKVTDLLIIKLDLDGNLIWSKTFATSYPGCNYGTLFYPSSIAEGGNEDVYIATTIAFCESELMNAALKLDRNGNLIWSTIFDPTSKASCTVGIYFEGSRVRLLGHASYNKEQIVNVHCLDLSPVTGKLITQKAYQLAPDIPFYSEFAFMHRNAKSVKLENGHYMIYGQIYHGFIGGPIPPQPFSILEFSENFELISAYSIVAPLANRYYNDPININASGRVEFGVIDPSPYITVDILQGSIQNGSIIRQRLIRMSHSTSIPSDFITLKDGAHVMITQMGKYDAPPFYIDFIKLHDNDPVMNECMGIEGDYFSLKPVAYIPFDELKWTSITQGMIHSTQNDVFTKDLAYEEKLDCPEIICDTLKINGPELVCYSGQPIKITAHRREGCVTPIAWSLQDKSNSADFTNINDSTIIIQTNENWEGIVRATLLPGCSLTTDSMEIKVFQAATPIFLGADTAICEGTNLNLKAGSQYASYSWQDLATDSNYTVSRTGKYYVTAMDGCRNKFSDTIIVSTSPQPSDFLPADTVLCGSTTMLISSRRNFIEYEWNTGEQNKVIEIKTGGLYSLLVKNQSGCRGIDSILVKEIICGNTENTILFPNAFTPNKDLRNDIFKPYIKGNLISYQLKIYNRWGQLVANSKNPETGWDGDIGGKPQGSGSYLWICTYQFESNPQKTDKGSLMLIR